MFGLRARNRNITNNIIDNIIKKSATQAAKVNEK